MRRRVVWMFSGQGGQTYQMARELFEKSAVFRREFERASEVARRLISVSLPELLYSDERKRFEPFIRTLETHPAILAVEWGAAQMCISDGLQPDLVLGYSLGEAAAWAVAGAISIEAALKTAIQQALLLEYCAPGARMLAVLESPALAASPEFSEVELACVNFERSFVVTGLPGAIERLKEVLKGKGVAALELPVSHGFHSRWMEPIAVPFRDLLCKLQANVPRVPVWSARTAGQLEQFDPEHFWRATRGRVEFQNTIEELEKEGPNLYVDLGPSGSLATAVKYLLGGRGSTVEGSQWISLLTPFGQEWKQYQRILETHPRTS